MSHHSPCIRSWCLTAALTGTVALLVSAVTIPISDQHSGKRLLLDDGRPAALARHLDSLKQTIPGNLGESPDGPGSAADQEFFQRAYPDADIPLANIQAARNAAAAIAARGFPTGKGRPGTWVTVGPSDALSP